MGSGYLDWSSRKVTNADMRDYLQTQTVMVFASASARDTALSGVLAEPLYAFLTDTNTLTVYSGSAWSTVGPLHGALTAWTPTMTQSASITLTNNGSCYRRVGRDIMAYLNVTATSAGTAGQPILLGTLPATMAAVHDAEFPLGVFSRYDASGPSYSLANVPVVNTSTTIKFVSSSGVEMGGGGFTIASGDIFRAEIAFQASSDA